MRFRQASRALVARVFRLPALHVVEVDHQSGNFSRSCFSARTSLGGQKLTPRLRPSPTPCGRDADVRLRKPRPKSCSATRAMLPQRGPRSSSGVPRLALLSSLNAGGHSQAREADCEPANLARVTTSRRYCRACPRSWPQWLLLTRRLERKCSC